MVKIVVFGIISFDLVKHHIDLIERFYDTSFIMLVSQQNKKKAYALNLKTKEEIFNKVYPKEVLSIKMNRKVRKLSTNKAIFS